MVDLNNLDWKSLESRVYPGMVSVSRLEDFIRDTVLTAVSPKRIIEYCAVKKILVAQFDHGAPRGPQKFVQLDKCKGIAAGIRAMNIAAEQAKTEKPAPVVAPVAQASLPLASMPEDDLRSLLVDLIREVKGIKYDLGKVRDEGIAGRGSLHETLLSNQNLLNGILSRVGREQ